MFQADDALTAEAVQSNAGDDVGDPDAAEEEAQPELPPIPAVVPAKLLFSRQGERAMIAAPSDAIGKQSPPGDPRPIQCIHCTVTDAGKSQPSQALKLTSRR